MWNLVASLFALAIMAIVALMADSHATAAIQEAALSQAEAQTGQLLAQFAAAARADAAARGYSAGTQMTVPMLIQDGALPPGFPAVDPFGMTLTAVVGQTAAGSVPVLAWSGSAPTNFYGLTPGPQTYRGVFLQVAQNAAASQQNSGALYGVSSAGQLLMPFANTPVDLSSVFPGVTVPDAMPMVAYMN